MHGHDHETRDMTDLARQPSARRIGITAAPTKTAPMRSQPEAASSLHKGTKGWRCEVATARERPGASGARR